MRFSAEGSADPSAQRARSAFLNCSSASGRETTAFYILREIPLFGLGLRVFQRLFSLGEDHLAQRRRRRLLLFVTPPALVTASSISLTISMFSGGSAPHVGRD
jgi:hypothetical protein